MDEQRDGDRGPFSSAWEWLVAHVWWTNVAFVTLIVVFLPDDVDFSDPRAWATLGLVTVLLWAPAGVRMRRVYLHHYNRAEGR